RRAERHLGWHVVSRLSHVRRRRTHSRARSPSPPSGSSFCRGGFPPPLHAPSQAEFHIKPLVVAAAAEDEQPAPPGDVDLTAHPFFVHPALHRIGSGLAPALGLAGDLCGLLVRRGLRRVVLASERVALVFGLL